MKAFERPQRWAGIVHNWLYHQRGYDKARTDAIFRAVLKSEGAGRIRTTSMYGAVKLFGRSAFERNQRRDLDKRIWGNPAYPDHGSNRLQTRWCQFGRWYELVFA